MPRRIDEDKCISCGWCIPQCPVDCISHNEDRFTVEIDESICIDCGACQQVCPTTAINEAILNITKEYKEKKNG